MIDDVSCVMNLVFEIFFCLFFLVYVCVCVCVAYSKWGSVSLLLEMFVYGLTVFGAYSRNIYVALSSQTFAGNEWLWRVAVG